MSLSAYNKKRHFKKTPEPEGKKSKSGKDLHFVVQKHDASHMHYDLRLEMDRVMKSWAVPKGPSLNPNDKRLAMQVEDHPISYNSFEGTIPHGEYGAGEVIVWDNGTYISRKGGGEEELLEGLEKGTLTIVLNGKKLKGEFALIRFKGKEKEWMLIKKADEFASEEDVTLDNSSVLSNKTLIGKTEDSEKYKLIKKKDKIRKLNRISPMLTTLAKPFTDSDWIFEIKWDGFRTLANVNNGKVDLYSRNFNSYNEKFSSIVSRLKNIKDTVILDGEVVAYDQEGNVRFQELQNIGIGPVSLEYMIFDILHLNGEDLTDFPLIERKEILKKFINKYPELKESEYIEKEGEKFFNLAIKQNVEGIVAKKKNSPYVAGERTSYWLKIKNLNQEEAIIVGYTIPGGTRKYFGSLVLGIYKGKELRFAGHVGTGFNDKTLKDLKEKMDKLITNKSPFKEKIPLQDRITWIKPKLVAQLKFSEFTKEGIMRQAVFLGLREDKLAEDVKIIKEINMKKNKNDNLKLSNLDKIYFPKLKLTKEDVIDYYEKISPYILPYLKDRPESLNRHPDGINKPNFYHKNFTTKTPSFVKTFKIKSESKNEYSNYLVVQNKDTLLYMANLGCIEINPWNSKIESLDFPDYMIFDLDPKGSTWKNLITVAKELKKVLDVACKESYIKTSGKSGLHICIPLHAKYHFDDVRNFCLLIAQIVYERLPDITSLERDPKKRKNKIYIDYLQNRIGQTTAGVYSLRPTEEATISTPLKWEELTVKFDPKKLNIFTIHKRLKKVGDLWKPVITKSIDLKKSIINLERMLNSKSPKQQ